MVRKVIYLCIGVCVEIWSNCLVIANCFLFAAAFKATIEKFKVLDIVINNAGVMKDEIWEKEIAINCVCIKQCCSSYSVAGLDTVYVNIYTTYRQCSSNKQYITNTRMIINVNSCNELPLTYPLDNQTNKRASL